jgi:hypothetical protein
MTFRDRRHEGFALVATGAALFVPAGLLFVTDTLNASLRKSIALVLASAGLVAILAGVRWIRRRVELSEHGISVRGMGNVTTIAIDAVASVAIRQELRTSAQQPVPGLILRVKDGDGRSARLLLRSAAEAAVAQRWLDFLCEKLLARWRTQLNAGETVVVSKQITLRGSLLVRKRTRIDLDQPFALQEVPATSLGEALLTLIAAGERVILEASDENHPVLRRFLLDRRKRAAAGTTTS